MTFFALFAVIGLLSYRDYGIPYDEGIMDALGRDSYNYVFNGDEWPTNEDWRHHGTFIELPIYAIQKLFVDPTDPERVYVRVWIRHFLTFITFFLATLTFFFLARRHFKNTWYALLCCLMFVLTPRIFAHGFYNSRDIPQLMLFTLGILTMLRLLEQPTPGRAVVHGVVMACALATRLTAMILPVFTILLLVLEMIRMPEHRKELLRTSLKIVPTFFIVMVVMTWALWPFLWEQPITHFLEAYRFMSTLGGSAVELLGKTYDGMPWHYPFVWIAATVPVIYTLFFLIGIVTILVELIRSFTRLTERHRNELLFLLWFFLPIVSLWVTGAGIYNEWRHLFFIYPAFLLIAVTAVRQTLMFSRTLTLWPKRIVSGAVIGLVTLQMLLTGAWMLRNHPFENVYFSIPSTWVEGNFYLDYWALSYKQAMEVILNDASDEYITVYSDENVAFINAYNLYPFTQGRLLRAEEIGEAQYVVTRDPAMLGELPILTPIRMDRMLINAVYKGPKYGQKVIID